MGKRIFSTIASISSIIAGNNAFYSEQKHVSTKRISANKAAIIPAGCKIFTIEGKQILALNYKSALRKAKKC